ncbi:MAG: SNF2-related protein [Candidatus Brachytrichaceae bacterium NZ_4S206]|jgi:superfamily II DNA or RNA helicase
MPTIIDNDTVNLLDQLKQFVKRATRFKACVGFLNIKGWQAIGDLIASLPANPGDPPCRLLLGMMQQEEGFDPKTFKPPLADGAAQRAARARVLDDLKRQITRGVPTDRAQAALRLLAQQIKDGVVRVQLYACRPLHAKLYLLRRDDPVTPLIGYVGSSNLTFAGLRGQGELNVDVVEQDAARKLEEWFDRYWGSDCTVDISDDLVKAIDASWAGEPTARADHLAYLVYLKVAYHLSEDARLGAREFKLPADLRGKLLDYQVAAVQTAARLVQRHGGVLLGDVVGLGKTLMATALARLLHEVEPRSTLVICPPKLQPMWEDYLDKFLRAAGADARTLSLGKVQDELPQLRRYRTLIIDESHNLTNRNAQRYQAIRDYIQDNDPQVILLTATPYNKRFTDLSNQLGLFLDEQKELPSFPQRYLDAQKARGVSEQEVAARIQAPLNSLRCFERSEFAEDWRALMRHYMVRRTRSFIIRNYGQLDPLRQRHFVGVNGERFYFPERQPRTVKIPLGDTLYDRLYSDEALSRIENLTLARYGLAEYLDEAKRARAPREVKAIADDLARAGQRLIGFARTSLFKRLESSGRAFLRSVERQMLRNAVALHALERGEPLPIGEQDIARFDPASRDADAEFADETSGEADVTAQVEEPPTASPELIMQAIARRAEGAYAVRRAEGAYAVLRAEYAHRFRWMPVEYFRREALQRDLQRDNAIFAEILRLAHGWRDDQDPKFARLLALVQRDHPRDKVLVFTQFADTAEALGRYLRQQGVRDLGVVTSASDDPGALVRRFSPRANGGLRDGESELRVLIATDALSEGQNLQDAFIVVNFDLPWAIVRLIQRAGRVDRVGQAHDTILVYSFLPAEGIERVIRLRQMLSRRLQENQEVIGTDETFFDESAAHALEDLYSEKAHVLNDAEEDDEVDLTSRALEVWQSAAPEMRERARQLPPQVYVSRPNDTDGPDGAIVFARIVRGSERDDRLIRVDAHGERLEHTLAAVFEAMRCAPETPALDNPGVFDLISAANQALEEETQANQLEGSLGSARNLRRKLYDRMKRIAEGHTTSDEAARAQASHLAGRLFQFALSRSVEDRLRSALRIGLNDADLVALLAALDGEGQLVVTTEPTEARVEILCAMGLKH